MTEERDRRAPGAGVTPEFKCRHSEAAGTGDQVKWQCPHCAHCLDYAPRDREAAELAANSHLKRRHLETKSVALLPVQ